MSKRKRASLGKTAAGTDQPAGEEGTTSAADDAAAKEDMVHVSPDLLAGSPDIFAPKWSDPPAAEESREVVTEPVAAETSIESNEPSEPVPTESTPVLAPAVPPPPVFPTAQAPERRRSGGSSAALGVVLVVVGLFALGVVLFGIDLTQYGWPLFVIIPGLTLLVVGFLGGGQGASIPGGIVTMLGLLLAYSNSTGDWPSWAFAWSLIAPFGIGLGMYLQALRDRDLAALRRGRTLMFVGLLIFMIGFVLFESILGISDMDYGVFGKAALPGLLVVIGLILLVRSIQRSRRA